MRYQSHNGNLYPILQISFNHPWKTQNHRVVCGFGSRSDMFEVLNTNYCIRLISLYKRKSKEMGYGNSKSQERATHSFSPEPGRRGKGRGRASYPEEELSSSRVWQALGQFGSYKIIAVTIPSSTHMLEGALGSPCLHKFWADR
jgi:hypothetical protein